MPPREALALQLTLTKKDTEKYYTTTQYCVCTDNADKNLLCVPYPPPVCGLETNHKLTHNLYLTAQAPAISSSKDKASLLSHWVTI